MNLEDIAKKAGVSRSTVSRVINDEPHVSEKTRRRVLAIIQREGFSPNHAARALVTQRTNIVSVVVPQTMNIFFGDNSYYPMLLQGMSEAISQRDRAMLLWLQQMNERVEVFIERVLSSRRMVDGFIISSVRSNNPIFDYLINLKTTFVMVERPWRLDEKVNYVTIDNIAAGRMAVKHLIGLGRKRIATITGDMLIADAQDRLAGYKAALVEAGMPVNPDLIFHGYFNAEYGYHGMKYLLQYKPDALFAAGDTTAVGAIKAIREAGLRVPDDIAVIGHDDLDVAAQYNLTTIYHPVQRKGFEAASLLIDMIEGKVTEPRHIILPIHLIVRDTCGADPLWNQNNREVRYEPMPNSPT
ncbi:MAG: LacI family DNA-binding transcriptional regulator [Anaerolineae bacterium]|nr:LacI family DNA-binding transcriptional regulator [Anaerolineae bacterium]